MFLNLVNKAVKVVTIFFLSVMTVMVAIEVILRYGFGRSLYVTEELTRYLMVWVVFLASSLAIRDSSHISIELIPNLFRGRVRAVYNLIAQGFLLFFLFFLGAKGIEALTFQMGQIIPTLNIPMFWFYLSIPVGSLLMILNLLPKVRENLKALAGRAGSGEPKPSSPGSEPGGFL